MLSYLLKTFWGVQASVGAIFNFVAISFFYNILRSKNRRSNQENFMTKMLLILTVFDLLVCFFAAGRLAFMAGTIKVEIASFGYSLFTTLLFLSSDTTAFLTLIMTITRTINMLKPQHIVDQKLVYISIFAYNVIMVISSGMFPRYPAASSLVKFLILTTILIFVVVSNIICIIRLQQTYTVAWKRRAAITVAILSLIFCLTNIGYIGIIGRFLFTNARSVELPYKYRVVFLYSLPQLNSTANPIVIFLRSRKMKDFLRGQWSKLTTSVRKVFLPSPTTTQNDKEVLTKASLSGPSGGKIEGSVPAPTTSFPEDISAAVHSATPVRQNGPNL